MTTFAAVDIGTSFTKGGIVDVESGQIRNLTRRPAAARIPSTNVDEFEIDAEEILHSVRELITSLLRSSPACNGILICGQMGGLILCDEQSRPLRPYLSWLDKRSASAPDAEQSTFDELFDELGERSQRVLGNEVRPGLTLSSLFHLKKTGALSGFQNAYPVTLPDFVATALCSSTPVIERTSTPGLLDVTSRTLAISLFEELGLTDLRWPEVVDFRHCVGEFATGGSSIPVYAGTGDHQCSLAGTHLRADELSINISTGSQVSIISDHTHVGDFQLRSYFDGRMLRSVTNIPAGRALSAVVALLSETGRQAPPTADDWDYFLSRAEETNESDIDVSLALFPGAVEGPGHFCNLKEGNLTVGHVARACLTKMADTYYHFGKQIADRSEWSRIALSGGVAQQSPLLRRLIADQFRSEYRLADTREDALNGLMVLGRVIAGLDDNVADATAALSKMAR